MQIPIRLCLFLASFSVIVLSICFRFASLFRWCSPISESSYAADFKCIRALAVIRGTIISRLRWNEFIKDEIQLIAPVCCPIIKHAVNRTCATTVAIVCASICVETKSNTHAHTCVPRQQSSVFTLDHKYAITHASHMEHFSFLWWIIPMVLALKYLFDTHSALRLGVLTHTQCTRTQLQTLSRAVTNDQGVRERYRQAL